MRLPATLKPTLASVVLKSNWTSVSFCTKKPGAQPHALPTGLATCADGSRAVTRKLAATSGAA